MEGREGLPLGTVGGSVRNSALLSFGVVGQEPKDKQVLDHGPRGVV
jgi:hypothetical protein